VTDPGTGGKVKTGHSGLV